MKIVPQDAKGAGTEVSIAESISFFDTEVGRVLLDVAEGEERMAELSQGSELHLTRKRFRKASLKRKVFF